MISTETTVLPGLTLRDLLFDLPLDHARPEGPTIQVYARALDVPEREHEAPWLVFLQGGPGFGAPRPSGVSGWIKRALRDYRVLLLDQRGTGRSTPISVESVRHLEHDAAALADYLACFRADAIVADCEVIRRRLIGERRWTLLGQSYGGFCTARYLSVAPHGLRGAIFTGGLPPLSLHADDVYRATYRRALEQNRRYYARYPGDITRVREVFEHVAARPELRLPEGGPLSPRKLQQLGLLLGFHDGHETIHYLFEDAWVPGRRELSYKFLRGFEHALPFDTNPLYTLLHEACYAQGSATRWSAERIRAEFPAFTFTPGETEGVRFTGEMIYPWMFQEWPRLRPFAAAAERLAARGGWPTLYDPQQLARNEVPAAAVIYEHDMYVERRFSEQTAGAIRGLKTWETARYPHSGLRAAGEVVLGRLLELLHAR